MEGNGEGVERRMVVEMAPRLGVDQLYGAIEDCRGSDEQAEERGIEGVDVAEMDHVGMATIEACDHEGGHAEHHDGKHDEQVGVGEEVDEARDGVVGCHGGEHVGLVHPADGLLVAGHLHPYGVDGVGGQRDDVAHHQRVFSVDADSVYEHAADGLGGLLHDDLQAVGGDHEVVVLRVVMGGVERHGVHLFLGGHPSVGRRRLLVVAARQEK